MFEYLPVILAFLFVLSSVFMKPSIILLFKYCILDFLRLMSYIGLVKISGRVMIRTQLSFGCAWNAPLL